MVESALGDRVADLLRETAARLVMPRFAAGSGSETDLKAGNEPVTIADREAEAALSAGLPALLPGSRVIGEEACAAAPQLLETLGEGTVWLVDPIDGTANFAAGRAPFAIMVALLKEGEPVRSWILDPLSGRLAVAEAGAGAWIEGERMRTAQEPVPAGRLRGIVSDAFIPAERRELLDRLRAAVAGTVPTLRCAGHEYPLVATGARDFALYWRTRAWDHAPGALLLREAGGSVTHLDGTPYRPTDPRAGLLLARNGAIAGELLAALGHGEFSGDLLESGKSC